MRVYISADIEGVTGLVSWAQCGRPHSDHYDYRWAREMMAHDVNAAIRGARGAGAEHIVVKDSHGNSKNLLIDMLEPGVELVSGHGSGADGMMMGIDANFDAALLIGYHAMAGTLHGVMEHTVSGRVHRMTINGMPAGEIALSTGVAGRFGVPIVAVSSDAAGCAEARQLVPFVQTATTKEGFGRYMAKCLHPRDTARAIEEAAREGVRRCKSIDPWLPDEPVVIAIEFNRTEEADFAARLAGAVRKDAYTVEVSADDYATAHRMAWSAFSMAGVGGDSNN